MAVGSHGFLAQDGLQCADEDAAGHAFRFAGDVDAVVHAIDEVDVRMTGRPEHDPISLGNAAKAVGCGVGGVGDVRPEISFHLNDAPGQPARSGATGQQLT